MIWQTIKVWQNAWVIQTTFLGILTVERYRDSGIVIYCHQMYDQCRYAWTVDYDWQPHPMQFTKVRAPKQLNGPFSGSMLSHVCNQVYVWEAFFLHAFCNPGILCSSKLLRLEQSESCISSVHTYLKISSNCGFSPPFLAAKSGLGCKQPYRQSQKQQ